MRSYTPPSLVQIPDQATKVFAGEIFDVYQWEQERFDGTTAIFEMLRRPDSVQIIAVHENKILVCKEQQPHTPVFLDIPAGMHDHAEEDELAGAKRELREETGYTFKNWKLIAARQGSKKVDQVVYTFLATEVESINDQQLDVGESIEVLQYSFEEFTKLKSDPIARSYPYEVMDQTDSLEALLSLPTLHEYRD